MDEVDRTDVLDGLMGELFADEEPAIAETPVPEPEKPAIGQKGGQRAKELIDKGKKDAAVKVLGMFIADRCTTTPSIIAGKPRPPQVNVNRFDRAFDAYLGERRIRKMVYNLTFQDLRDALTDMGYPYTVQKDEKGREERVYVGVDVRPKAEWAPLRPEPEPEKPVRAEPTVAAVTPSIPEEYHRTRRPWIPRRERVMKAILEHEPVSALDISGITKIEASGVYNTLKDLNNEGVIDYVLKGKTKIYHAVRHAPAVETSNSGGTIKIQADITKANHEYLKMVCDINGLTMSAAAAWAISAWIENRQKVLADFSASQRRKEHQKIVETAPSPPEETPARQTPGNYRITKYLAEYPDATVDEISIAVGLSKSTVRGSLAWKDKPSRGTTINFKEVEPETPEVLRMSLETYEHLDPLHKIMANLGRKNGMVVITDEKPEAPEKDTEIESDSAKKQRNAEWEAGREARDAADWDAKIQRVESKKAAAKQKEATAQIKKMMAAATTDEERQKIETVQASVREAAEERKRQEALLLKERDRLRHSPVRKIIEKHDAQLKEDPERLPTEFIIGQIKGTMGDMGKREVKRSVYNAMTSESKNRVDLLVALNKWKIIEDITEGDNA